MLHIHLAKSFPYSSRKIYVSLIYAYKENSVEYVPAQTDAPTIFLLNINIFIFQRQYFLKLNFITDALNFTSELEGIVTL